MKGFCKKTCFSVILSAVLLIGTSLSAFAADATINDDGTRVRSDSSTDSAVVVTASKGTTYPVLDTVTGSDGNTWYKVQVSDGTEGYIRGDLVSVSGDAGDDAPSDVTSSSPVTPIQPMNVTTSETANIRSGAGTDSSRVGAIESGTEITITGEAMAADGYKWYEMNCDSKSISGYIRSDFVNVDEGSIVYAGNEETSDNEGEGEEYPTDEIDENTAVDETHNDYEIVYTTDDDGVYQYYLYNHIDNTKQKVESLLEAVNTLNDKYKEANKKLSTFKILTILFGALTVIAGILAVFFFFRSRSDEYYYEEDFEEKKPARENTRPKNPQPEREQAPRRPSSQGQAGEQRPRRRPEEASEERPERKPRPEGEKRPRREGEASADAEERRSAQRPHPSSEDEERPAKRPPRRPQNFLADDDDLEFEFLDMDE